MQSSCGRKVQDSFKEMKVLHCGLKVEEEEETGGGGEMRLDPGAPSRPGNFSRGD